MKYYTLGYTPFADGSNSRFSEFVRYGFYELAESSDYWTRTDAAMGTLAKYIPMFLSIRVGDRVCLKKSIGRAQAYSVGAVGTVVHVTKGGTLFVDWEVKEEPRITELTRAGKYFSTIAEVTDPSHIEDFFGELK